MSRSIASTDWPNNMSANDRKVWLHEQITNWVGEKRIEECLSALELGNLSMTEKAVAYRSVLIVGSIKHCRKHQRAEARIPILTLITYLSDNAKGRCFLSISKMHELFDRSRQCIVDNILALEEDGLIGIARIDGMPNCYWPRIPTALVQMSPNPVWVIDALTTVSKARIFGSVHDAIAAATELDGNQSTGVDQSGRVDRYRSSPVDPTSQVQQAYQSSPADQPVKSSTDSISSLNLSSSSQVTPAGEMAGATQKGGSPLHGKQFQKGDDMLAALNPDAAARKAYARANVAVSKSGKVTIGSEFRQELLDDGNTHDQIEAGLALAPKYIKGSDPEAWMKTVRTALMWAKENDRKEAARVTRSPGITGRSGRPSI